MSNNPYSKFAATLEREYKGKIFTDYTGNKYIPRPGEPTTWRDGRKEDYWDVIKRRAQFFGFTNIVVTSIDCARDIDEEGQVLQIVVDHDSCVLAINTFSD